MKKVILAAFLTATALAISPVALAQNYDFTFTGVESGPYVGSVGTGTFDVVGG